MLRRCYGSDPKSEDYRVRGIVVCERWRGSFNAFFEDMGERPGREYSIERIDNDGDYEPGNCKWATAAEQSLNQRRTIFVERGGARVKLMELCRDLGVNYARVHSRVVLGWDLERALWEPAGPRGRKPKNRS